MTSISNPEESDTSTAGTNDPSAPVVLPESFVRIRIIPFHQCPKYTSFTWAACMSSFFSSLRRIQVRFRSYDRRGRRARVYPGSKVEGVWGTMHKSNDAGSKRGRKGYKRRNPVVMQMQVCTIYIYICFIGMYNAHCIYSNFFPPSLRRLQTNAASHPTHPSKTIIHGFRSNMHAPYLRAGGNDPVFAIIGTKKKKTKRRIEENMYLY